MTIALVYHPDTNSVTKSRVSNVTFNVPPLNPPPKPKASASTQQQSAYVPSAFPLQGFSSTAEGGEQELSSDAIKQGGALTSGQGGASTPEQGGARTPNQGGAFSSEEGGANFIETPFLHKDGSDQTTGSPAQWDNEAEFVKRDLDLSTYTPSPLSRTPAPTVKAESPVEAKSPAESPLPSETFTSLGSEVTLESPLGPVPMSTRSHHAASQSKLHQVHQRAKVLERTGRELQQKLTLQRTRMKEPDVKPSRAVAHAKWDDEVTRILQDLKEQQLVIDRVAFGQSSTTPSFLKVTDDTATIAYDDLIAYYDSLPSDDIHTRVQLTHVLQLSETKDMSWKSILANDDTREAAIAAGKKELDSLTTSILEEISPSNTALMKTAMKKATKCRLLLDFKRTGVFKARLVKQGFLEHLVEADGVGFSYYASVTRLEQVRAMVFQPSEGDCLASLDVSTAFLQSDKYADGHVKYAYFKDPVTNNLRYFVQSGPIYGESSAPVLWQRTLFPVLERLGFVAGKNDPCAFLHPDGTSLLVWVDDILMRGRKNCIQDFVANFRKRFKAKDVTWLEDDVNIDFVGMIISQTKTTRSITMQPYIENLLVRLKPENYGMSAKPQHVPIEKGVTDFTELNADQRRFYLTGTGSIGWLVSTGRPDVAYLYSRLSQYLSSPCVGAFELLLTGLSYLKQHANLGLSCSRSGCFKPMWQFFSDSDFAGDSELAAKRRSTNGLVVLLNGTPIKWSATKSSVCFPHPKMTDAAADTSSASAEIYAAGNAVLGIIAMSYQVEEIGIAFPLPFKLQIDNAAALSFMFNTTLRTRLRHIDCRQEFVLALRDQDVVRAEHVDSKFNKADLFTKILDQATFEYLRDMLMTPVECTTVFL